MNLNLRRETFGNKDNLTWLGPGDHGWDSTFSLTLDGPNMVAAFTDGIVPSGVEISRAASGRYTLGAAGDDPCFLLHEVRVDIVAQNHVGGAGFWHGVVIAAKVPVPGGGTAPVQANHPHIRLV